MRGAAKKPDGEPPDLVAHLGEGKDLDQITQLIGGALHLKKH